MFVPIISSLADQRSNCWYIVGLVLQEYPTGTTYIRCGKGRWEADKLPWEIYPCSIVTYHQIYPEKAHSAIVFLPLFLLLRLLLVSSFRINWHSSRVVVISLTIQLHYSLFYLHTLLILDAAKFPLEYIDNFVLLYVDVQRRTLRNMSCIEAYRPCCLALPAYYLHNKSWPSAATTITSWCSQNNKRCLVG